jgi:hypothetical protein
MDAIITFEEVTEFLKNPPSLAPHPDFNQLCPLHQHIMTALKQLTCPQSLIHGWSGLAINPGVYMLLEPQAFTEPPNPGACRLPTIFATSNNENDRRDIHPGQELLLVVFEHQPSMLQNA